MKATTALIRSLRPEQWIKNFIVFAALIFSREFTNIEMIELSVLAFIVFCFSSSAIYLINDVVDYRQDSLHPEKRNRPIASGHLTRSSAIAAAVLLIFVSIVISVSVFDVWTVGVVVAFVVLNVVYSFWLKNVVILDVMAIAGSFVLRAVGGGLAISVPISPWLVVCTILLALFIGFGKRRHELKSLEEAAAGHRKSLEHYSLYFLDQMIAVVTASTVVAYTFYTLSPEVKDKLGVKHLELSIPFVLYGIFRYLYLIHKQDRGGSPSRILVTDIPILVNVLLWLATVLILMQI